MELVLVLLLFATVTRTEYRLIGGDSVDITSVPYQLSLRYYSQHVCGGAILSPTVAITAAHCLPKPGAYSVKAGVTKLSEAGAVLHVKKALIHPKYTSDSNDFDLAILFLNSSLPQRSNIRPVQLPPSAVEAGTSGTLTGWGVAHHGAQQHYSDKLMRVQLPIWEWGRCKAVYPEITENSFCAGWRRGWKGGCPGDSGGPFVVDNFLYGLLSAGTDCAQPGSPGVYTNLQVLRDFVLKNAAL